jgi:hypothetical protein
LTQETAFAPLPRSVREESRRARQDAFKKERTQKRYLLAAIFPASVALIVSAASVAYVATTERSNYYAVVRSAAGVETFTRLNSNQLPSGQMIEAIEYWIRDLRTITIDPAYNSTVLRGRALARLNVDPAMVLSMQMQMEEELPPQTKEATWVTHVYDVQVTPVAFSQDPTWKPGKSKESPPALRQWHVEWEQETQDLSVGSNNTEIVKTKWSASIITHEGEPEQGNPSGILFEPMTIRERVK